MCAQTPNRRLKEDAPQKGMPGLSLGLCCRSDPRRAEGMESGRGDGVRHREQHKLSLRGEGTTGKMQEGGEMQGGETARVERVRDK